MTLQTYQGSCHCGHVLFEVDADIDHVRICNCSICHKRGALMFRVTRDALRLIQPEWDGLKTYKWGSGTATDFLCSNCGILPFRHPSAPTNGERAQGVKPFDGFAVNTRCLANFDPSSVPRRQIDGRAIVQDSDAR